MDDENEGDIEEDFVIDSDFGTVNEDFYTVEEISSDFSRAVNRAVPQQEHNDTIALSWHDSDLNLVIDGKTFCTACPLHGGGFCFLQGGVRATHGFTTGSVCFEVKLVSLCNIRYIDGHLNSHLIRVGWSTNSSSLALGSDPKSFGYDSNGKATNNGESKIYGKTWTVDDVIGAYLDFSETMVSISFTKNGEDQGIAYKVSHSELNHEALFPHILSKNIAFECNFRSESSWFPPMKGYSFVGDMPLNKRIPGPIAPKRPADCEIIMMIGLPRSGKTSWAQQLCAKNPGKYYILDVLQLVDKMEIMDPYRYSVFRGKAHVLKKLLKLALTRSRGYILDQVNPSAIEWHWKLKLFKSYGRRRAVVCTVPDEELQKRLKKRPVVQGPEYIECLKGKFILPKPSFLLNKVDYVGLPQREAENLFKSYFEEAKGKGCVSHKKLRYDDLFYMKTKEQPADWKLFLLGKGPNPFSPKAKKAWKYQARKQQRKQQSGAIAFVSGGVYNESSRDISQVELSTRNFDFQDDADLLRRGQSPSTRSMDEQPTHQQSIHRMSSLSPPRNISYGREIAPDGRGGKDFYEQQDPRPLQSGGQFGWRTQNRSSDSNYPPLRGDGATQEGRLEHGLPTQNCSAGSSLNRRGSEFEEFHPQRTSSGLLSSQNMRQGVGFPLTREISTGEGQMSRDYAQRQRTAFDFPPPDTRDSDGGLLRAECQLGGKFPPLQSRMYDHCSPRKTLGGGLSTLEDRPGRLPEVEGSLHGPLRQRDNYSPQREQMRSRGQGREIPFNEKKMVSREEITPCSSRGDSFPYSENRMENEITQNNVRTLSNVLPILGERMILGSGDRPSDDVHSNVPEILMTGDRFLDDETQCLMRSEDRDCIRSDHFARDSRGVGIMARQESTLGSGLHPQHTRSISPRQEGRLSGGCLPFEMDFCGNKELQKSGNTDWNRGPGPMREHPFQDRREDYANQPGSTQGASSSHPPGRWKDSNRGDQSPGWGSRSPERRERFVSEDDRRWSHGPDRKEFPSSRSPVGGRRTSYHNRGLYSGGSGVSGAELSLQGSTRAPILGPGDSHGRNIRKLPEGGGRHSPSQGVRRSPGHGGWGREDSPDRFGRGSPDQIRSTSPNQYTRTTSPDQVQREFLAEIRDGSLYQLKRSSSNRSRSGLLDEVGAESSEQVQNPGKFREESPDHYREEHLDELRIELTDQFEGESPERFREEHPDRFRKVSRVRQSSDERRRERADYFERESQVQVRREFSDQFIRETPDQLRRESPDQFGMESPDRFRRESPDQFRRESPDRFGRESPDRFGRESLDRFGEEHPAQFGKESLDQLGGESLNTYREEHPGHLGRDQLGRGSAHQFRSGSPEHFKRGNPRGSSIRGSRGSFRLHRGSLGRQRGSLGRQRGFSGPQRGGSFGPRRRESPSPRRRGSPGPHRRGSPSPHRRGSPSPHRRGSPSPHRRGSPSPQRRGPPGPHRRRGFPGPQRRESPGLHRRRGSPDPHRRESPGAHRRRVSPNEHYRRSANRDSRGPHIHGAEGSPIRRSRSPLSRRSNSFGRVRRYSSDRNLRTSPQRNLRRSPTPQNSSPSAMSRSRTTSHLPNYEIGRSRRAQWHSPPGRYGNRRPRRGGMNRFNNRE